MPDALEVVTTVWTPETLIVAVSAGFLLGGVVVGKIVSLPAYVSDATPLEVAVGLALTGILAGAVFYVGQALVDVAEDVPSRLISRFSIWCLYVVAMGAGTGVRLAIGRRRHRRLVVEQAHGDDVLPPGVPRV